MIENLPGEEWRTIPGILDYYKVSNKGRIKGDARVTPKGYRHKEKLLKATNASTSVQIDETGRHKEYPLAALILRAFVGPCPLNCNLARHLDDDRTNNYVENLAWGTALDNYADAVKNGRHGPGSPGAIKRGAKLKGKPRSNWVKDKIRATKLKFPGRQNYDNPRNSKGQFTGREK